MDDSKPYGWFSPEYNRSRSIDIDFNIALTHKCMCLFPESPEIEYYKVLRTRVEHVMKKNNWTTLMITSANAGEGKTLTSVNLAISFAREFIQTVLLVDADLKKQDIHRFLGYSMTESLVDYLIYNKPFSDIMVWPKIEKMTVISGQNTVPDSSETLGSARMGELIHEMKSRYENRFILFDVPAVLNRADAIEFAPLVDGILMVVQSGRSKPHEIAKALAMLPKEKIIGFVLNRAV